MIKGPDTHSFSELKGDTQGAEDVCLVLLFKFLCSEYLGIAQSNTIPLEGKARLKVSHEDLLFNGMAVPKTVAVKEDVTNNCSTLKASEEIPVKAFFSTEISASGQTRTDTGRPEILFKVW